jgi:hypothetical protein
MNKFKVGDMATCLIGDYGNVAEGETRKVIRVNTVGDYICIEGGHDDYYRYAVEDFERAWPPQPGEMIEVSALRNPFTSGGQFHYEFLTMDGDQYVCRKGDGSDEFQSWPNARPIKPDTTITAKDGRSIELSEDSFKAIFGEAVKK